MILDLLYIRWRCRKMSPDYVTKLIIDAYIKHEIIRELEGVKGKGFGGLK